MAIKRSHSGEGTYFCTFTCLNWIPLFEETSLYDNIYDWFNLLTDKHHSIIGFVIMPNHLHLLIDVKVESHNSINKILANGKRFMAYEIIKRLQDQNRIDLLHILSQSVSHEERLRKKKHRVFESSSDIKPCFSEKFLLEKLTYIHNNPVSGKWKLSNIASEYPHSSAAFYDLNVRHPSVIITHFKDLN